MRRAWVAALALAVVAGAPSARAQSTRPLRLQVPPIDFRTPPDNNPKLGAGPDQAGRDDCVPEWPCRLRLFGVIEKNGGIGLKGTAWSW